MILCGTTFGKNRDSRFHLINRFLTHVFLIFTFLLDIYRDRQMSEPLAKPMCMEIGQMYIANLGEFLARVIIISVVGSTET